MKIRAFFVAAIITIGIFPAAHGAPKKKATVESAKPSADQALIDQAKGAVKLKMKDPESAQFRNVHIKAGEEAAVQGEVNAKNSYGGYAGFERFYWGRFKNAKGEYVGEKAVDTESEFIKAYNDTNMALMESYRLTRQIPPKMVQPKDRPEYKDKFVDGW